MSLLAFNTHVQETKKRRPSSARKPKRPAQKKRETKGAKGVGLLTPGVDNKEDNHDNPFEDPEKLYQVHFLHCNAAIKNDERYFSFQRLSLYRH